MVAGRGLGEPGGAAERGAEVVHVVADVLATVCRHQEVQGVNGPRVVVRQPCGKHMVRPQLAAMFVRVDVVGVVAAGAEVLEVPGGLAFVEARGRQVDAPVTVARREPQHRVEVALVEAAPPRAVADGRLVGDRDLGRIHPDRIDVLDVIPERVVHQRANQLGASGHLRVINRIDFELIGLARVARMFRHEARVETAWALAPDHHPVRGVEALELARSPGDLRNRQIADADAVGEPARVRHLVQRVHVDGADRLAGRQAGRTC